MTYKNYIIEYTIKDNQGLIIKEGKMRCKNRMSDFDAKVKFEEWIKKKYANFGRLIVHSCKEEHWLFGVNDIFKDFL